MKKGQEFLGYVESVNFPNKGIVWVEESEGEKEGQRDKEFAGEIKSRTKVFCRDRQLNSDLKRMVPGKRRGRSLK